jgi:hypothetical protein
MLHLIHVDGSYGGRTSNVRAEWLGEYELWLHQLYKQSQNLSAYPITFSWSITIMMNEIVPGLWLGDLPSALDVQNLKANNIHSILSTMRGRITVNKVLHRLLKQVYNHFWCHWLQTFIRHQILIDDTEDADILTHLLPSIHFIQAELDKGRGVLVHCQAGVSMYSAVTETFTSVSSL